MKSALFVDFDNVYSGLRRLDPAVADRFAFQPLAWIRWLTESLPAPPHAHSGASRRLLVRRCYLNPQVYQRFRPAFNRAGFEIIDCPAMTSEGKTSTDIHMVLDIVDLLQHEAHYDEFIVFSADADFTPVLRKLRRWDRRTTVLAIGFPSAAYQASADLLIDQDEFVRGGLGFEEAEEVPPPVEPSLSQADISRGLARFITKAVADSTRPVSLPWLASKAPGDVRGLDAATWSGFNTFRALVESIKLSPLVVNWDLGVIADPARHTLSDKAASSAPKSAVDPAKELRAVAQLVRSEVAKAHRPVPCSRLAQLITEQHGKMASDWAGKGTFRKFMEALELTPLRVDWSSAGGYVVDPNMPAFDGGATVSATTLDWGPYNRMLPLMGQVHTATDLPMLSPSAIRFLLEGLVADVAERPFQLTETGKRVRDRCREAGESISRADVNFVLKGILLGGHAFGQGPDDVDTLGTKFVESVLAMCQREQMALDDSQVAMLREWATGASIGVQR
jgi:hypothetical protein